MDHVGLGIWVHPAARFQVDVAALNATFAEALAPPSGADDDDGDPAHDDDIDPEDEADAGARTGFAIPVHCAWPMPVRVPYPHMLLTQ
ncbi:hypothetical protein [Komagataeibacter sp. FXV3]|uniref:hypothetical protein n=1 Tax=Komagataeibacter sp. FXV3 TaxID=2608998 RepID=UPI001D10AE06|nr:hypothetical protein [Komagataeibacter sp. FXV3]